MVCLSTIWFVAALLADMWVAAMIAFVAASLFAAGVRDDY